MVKNPLAMQDICDPWVEKIPWRREWLLTPVFLPGKFHSQRSLAGYSPQGHKESDTTEQLTHTHTAGTPCFLLCSLMILKGYIQQVGPATCFTQLRKPQRSSVLLMKQVNVSPRHNSRDILCERRPVANRCVRLNSITRGSTNIITQVCSGKKQVSCAGESYNNVWMCVLRHTTILVELLYQKV